MVEISSSKLSVVRIPLCQQAIITCEGIHMCLCSFSSVLFHQRLKYHTQWQVRAGRNKKARGRKISGIEPMPGEDKVTGLLSRVFYKLALKSSYYFRYTLGVDIFLKSSCFPVACLGSDHVKWFSNKTLWSEGQFSKLQVQRLRQFQQSNQSELQVSNKKLFIFYQQ